MNSLFSLAKDIDALNKCVNNVMYALLDDRRKMVRMAKLKSMDILQIADLLANNAIAIKDFSHATEIDPVEFGLSHHIEDIESLLKEGDI